MGGLIMVGKVTEPASLSLLSLPAQSYICRNLVATKGSGKQVDLVGERGTPVGSLAATHEAQLTVGHYPLPRAVHYDDEIARIFQLAGVSDEIQEITEPVPECYVYGAARTTKELPPLVLSLQSALGRSDEHTSPAETEARA